jgi:exopolysaccharide biosynthesis WecB/TagA/CpsF family protein
MIQTISLLGLDFACVDVAGAAAIIAARPADAPFAYVVTPNADHLVRIDRDRGLRAVYQQAAISLLDSRPISLLARLVGLPAPPVVPGSDLSAFLLTQCLRPGERITIIGLSPSWLPALMSRMNLAPPAHYNPPIGFDHDPAGFAAAVAFVRDHPARLVFLAVGSPRQERLAAAIAATGQATGTGLCIGASLEFLAGARQRAPRLMQLVALEWLYRLAVEPRRMARRYLIDSPKVLALLRQQCRHARALRSEAAAAPSLYRPGRSATSRTALPPT